MKIKFQNIKLFTFLFFATILVLACSKGSNEDVEIDSAINANTSSTIRVEEIVNSDAERLRLWRRQKIADFVPTGIFIKPDASITVSIDLVEGTHVPKLLLGTYSRFSSSEDTKSFNLSASNTLTVTNSSTENQMVYLRYASVDPNSICDVTIKGGVKTPHFVYNTTSQNEFVNQLETYDYSDVVLSSSYANIIISKERALQYKTQDWDDFAETIDEIIDIEAEIDGLDNSSEIHQRERNKYFLVETKDSRYYMAATDYRTFYNDGAAIHYLVDISKLTGDGWGIWHELGHQHQIASITWDAVSEVTVNVYSLAVERAMGHVPSRVTNQSVLDEVNSFFGKPIENRNYNNDLDYFPKLYMYYQLWVAYGDDFYKKLHKRARLEAYDTNSGEEKMTYFIRLASEISQNNLTDFFKKWGFSLPQSSYDAVDALNLPEPAEDLTLLRQ